MMRAAIVVMTRNPGEGLRGVLEQVNRQSQRFQRKIVVDSNSTDSACVHAAAQGFEVFSLGRQTFNHGGTREWCVKQLGDVEMVRWDLVPNLYDYPIGGATLWQGVMVTITVLEVLAS